MAGENGINGFAEDGAALLEDGVIHAPFDFEVHRGLGAVFVETDPEFEAIFVTVDGVAIRGEAWGVQVEAMDGIGKVGAGGAELIDLQVGGDEVPDRQGGFLADLILQLEALHLEAVLAHGNGYGVSAGSTG